MTFASPEMKDKFHRLPTSKQHAISRLEGILAQHGLNLHIQDIVVGSQVVIRVADEPVAVLPVDNI